MSKLTEYKKVVREDKFAREFYSCSNKIWARIKRHNRKKYRVFLKQELLKGKAEL